MAQQKKKSPSATGGRNPDRRNGKAWKKNKNKIKPARTADRAYRDMEILREREARREAGMERHRQKLEERAEAAAQLAAEIAAQAEAERKKRKFLGSLVKREVTAAELLELADEMIPLFSG